MPNSWSPALTPEDIWTYATRKLTSLADPTDLVKFLAKGTASEVPANKSLYDLIALDRLDDAAHGLSALKGLVDDLEARLTAARAGYLDDLRKIDALAVQEPPVGDSLGHLAKDVQSRVGTEGATSLADKLTVARAAKLDRDVAEKADFKYVVTESDALIASSDTERTEPATSYVKHKAIVVALPGKYRVKFDLKSADTGTVKGKIYKNGVALGTEQQTTGTTYETKSEDLDFEANDSVELYLMGAPGGNYSIARNFRLYGDISTVPYAEVYDV